MRKAKLLQGSKLFKKVVIISSLLLFFVNNVIAYGMAVALNHLALYNNSQQTLTIHAPNLSLNHNITLKAHSGCMIKQPVMFLPNLIDNDDNFSIVFSVCKQANPIYIATMNNLALINKTKYANSFHLFAACANDDVSKTNNEEKGFTTIVPSPIKTTIVDITNSPPQLAPAVCKERSYVYLYVFGKVRDDKRLLSLLAPNHLPQCP